MIIHDQPMTDREIPILGSPKELAWWQKAVFYQIYPRSFKDADGDGIGDLAGIREKLDYLKELGIDVIWLSPIYASPNEDNGYDISDYYSIHPDYGTMEEFECLVKEARERGIRIIMDLVINHTSTEHEWFKKSRRKESPYEEYYYWSDSWKGTPNNWTGFFGEKCWEYDEERDAHYLHLFAKHQADLNYHEPAVLEEAKNILRFWLEKGVAGFRCDVINILYKDSLKSSIPKPILTGSEHYLSLEGTHKILQQLHKVLEEYDAVAVGETVFVDTKQACDLTAPYRKELSMVFGFQHMEVDQIIVKWFKKRFCWKDLIEVLDVWQREVPWNTLYLENHDQPRSVSRFGSRKYPNASAKLMAVMLLTLRGTPFLFEGQEIGMRNFDYTGMEEIQDVESHNVYRLLRSLRFPEKKAWKIIKESSRDNARTPMQWDNSPHAGFTGGEPWLRENHNYIEINVEKQMRDPNSVWSCYKSLLAYRKSSRDLLEGGYQLLTSNDRFCAYRRGELVIVLNHSDQPNKVPYRGHVEFLTGSGDGYRNGDFIGMLRPWQAVILRPEKEH